METSTAARIERLVEARRARRADFARELTEALRYLMTLKLDAELARGRGWRAWSGRRN